MSDQYVGEIRMFAGSFAPVGWMLCQGQVLNISDYATLFSLIGTTYGGDGQTTFALPNLQSSMPIHLGTSSQGNLYTLGQTGGAETVTLTPSQLAAHSHAFMVSTGAGTKVSPNNAYLAGTLGGGHGVVNRFTTSAGGVSPTPTATSLTSGGGHAHENMPPFLVMNFIIAISGVFPSAS